MTVTHGDTGTKSISVSLSTAIYKSEVLTKSGTWTLDNIPRQATVSSAPDFNDEGNPAITYSNPAGNAVTTLQACISLTGSKDDIAYRDITKTGTSYTFNLTDAERKILRDACTTANSRTVYFYIKTIIGGVTLYSKLQKTLSIINANPTFTSSQLNYEDTDTTVKAITGDSLMIVQNKSNLKVKYTAATAKKSATISQYTFTLNGVTKTSTTAGGTIDFGKINSDKDLVLNVTVTDSRGNTASATKAITCYKYYSPSLMNFKAYRTDENGDIDANGIWLKCEYETNIAPVNGKNNRTIKIYGVGNSPITASGNSYLIDLNGDQDSTYNVYAVVTDSFGSTATSVTHTIYGGARIINVHPSGTAISLGKKAEKENLFECKWDAEFLGDLTIQNKSVSKFIANIIYPVGSVYVTTTNDNPSQALGGTWECFDKHLAFKHFESSSNAFWTPSSTNTKSSAVYATVEGHMVTFRFEITTNVQAKDDDILWGTVDFSKLGFTALNYSGLYEIGVSDAGESMIAVRLDYSNGQLKTVDINPKTDGGALAAGNTFYVHLALPIATNKIQDSACDKFYWKRTQ